MGRRLLGPIGERWDTRRLRRVREDGWFRQHEPEMIEEARKRVARARLAANAPSTPSEDAARRAAAAIVARAMDLIGEIDRPIPPRTK
jgi:hypothetical protein